ncbi:PaaX family transcriptional regulator [Nocardia crassostreae]|uniref:PaaX family transcriptional regulator n=1 Tax=Nocardia crassostreae TaxID=53428 RepID=UPI0008371362|nr:PaaX family transcriptional regulator C-terminal domain-containing protein [Nocardia crassostreae]
MSRTLADPAKQYAATPQPRQLIVTLFGLYARESGNWLSVSALVRLMAQLEVDEPAVRAAVSRLKRRGILLSKKTVHGVGYELSPAALEILREGDVRIFERRRATAADGWLLVVFSVPEAERDQRHKLRTQLTRMGFGNAVPGCWVAPGNLHEETRRTLERLELDRYVELFRGDHLAFGNLRDKVRDWWDLEELEGLYGAFIERFTPVRTRGATAHPSARDAFARYVGALTAWRKLPYLDPGLPIELLPDDWHGEQAARLFGELRRELAEPAHEFAAEVIAGAG